MGCAVAVGFADGDSEGDSVGCAVAVGFADGVVVGAPVGAGVGLRLLVGGSVAGTKAGDLEREGWLVGDELGTSVGFGV